MKKDPSRAVKFRAFMFWFHRYKWLIFDILLVATAIGAVAYLIAYWFGGMINTKQFYNI